jgi:hypothetical protein
MTLPRADEATFPASGTPAFASKAHSMATLFPFQANWNEPMPINQTPNIKSTA